MACKKIAPCKTLHCLHCNGCLTHGEVRGALVDHDRVVALACKSCGHVEMMLLDHVQAWVRLGLRLEFTPSSLTPLDD